MRQWSWQPLVYWTSVNLLWTDHNTHQPNSHNPEHPWKLNHDKNVYDQIAFYYATHIFATINLN